MPARGSGIGASMGASVWSGGATGRPASPATTAVYPGAPSAGRMSGWNGTPVPHLLALVLGELFVLGALRHGFRHHHGG